MTAEIFLDNNATTKPFPEVIEAVTQAMSTRFGNPSSNNRSGQRSRQVLRDARASVAQLIGAEPEDLCFTSGATEANNWVIRNAVPSEGVLLTTTMEHSSIKESAASLETVHGGRVLRLTAKVSGQICLDQLKELIEVEVPDLVSIHWVNNETGVIQPVEGIAKYCQERQIPLHVDASQAVGKLHVDVAQIQCDFLSFSSHKFHGPQGVGGLYIRPGRKLASLLLGGSQEQGLRAGTENLPGIAGLDLAAEIRSRTLESSVQQLQSLRDRFETSVLSQIPNVQVNGDPSFRVCNTSNLRFSNLDGPALVARLDQAGILCSQSSACTNQRPEPSYVLREMGLSESEAYSSVRFSVSVLNTEEEIDRAVTILADLVAQLRNFEQRVNQSA
jgi:cysteine desulfurase